MTETVAKIFTSSKNINVDGKIFKLLQEAHAVKCVIINTDKLAIYIQVQLKNGNLAKIQTTRGKLKYWSSFDTAINWLKNMGVTKAYIDLTYGTKI